MTAKIAFVKVTDPPRARLTADGYTVKSGSPTRYMVRLEGETKYRRLMCWQFSNAGTLFLRIKGENVVVPSSDVEAFL